MEPLSNFHWGLLSLGCMRLYHYVILQPISLATQVNLDSVICPAVSDPFSGPWYRLAANLHQTAFILLHGKIYCLIGSKFFAPKHRPGSPSDSDHESIDANSNSFKQINCNMADSNDNNNSSSKYSNEGAKNGINGFGDDIKSGRPADYSSKKVH